MNLWLNFKVAAGDLQKGEMRLCPQALLNCRISLRSFASTTTRLQHRNHDSPWPAEKKNEFARLMSNLDRAILNNDLGSVEQTVAEYKGVFPISKSQNFYNKAIEALMRVSRTDKARELFKSAVNDGFIPDTRTIVVLVDGFMRHTDVNRAKEIMKSMEVFGLKPNIKIMNLWILHYLREHQIEKARSIFKSLESQGLTPNVTTFLNFIRYFMKNADFEAAKKIKQCMFEMEIPPTTPFYNAILDLLFEKQALADVEDLLVEMDSKQIKPDQNTFNALIEGYSSLNMLDKAQELIRRMGDLNMKPSIVTFNRLLSSQAYALDVDQTKAILVQMNELGLQFNAYTYAALFKGLIAKHKYSEAVQMLFRMEENGILLPVEVHTNLVQQCCEHNLESAVYLLRTQLIKHDVSTSAYAYTVLIKYYLRHRNYKQVDGLLLEMQRTKNIIPGLHIFATLLNHFVEHLDIAGIKRTLDHMQSLKLELNKVIYNIVMKAFYVHCKCLDGGMVYRTELLPDLVTNQMKLCDPASRKTSVAKIKKDFEETFKIPFKPSIHIFNDIMNNFFCSGRYSEALDCYEEILNCDLVPNLFTITTLIKSRLYLGQIDEAKMVLKKMGSFGLTPTTLQCALIHHALCRDLRIEEAESFLTEITSIYKIRLNYVFYASLIYAHSRVADHFNVFKTFEKLRANNLKPDTEACNYVLISMFEVGQYEEADDFFRKMIADGIRRNHFTYAIMTDKHLLQTCPDKALAYLADCMLPGNTIDAFPFNRLLRHFYDRSQMDRLAEVLNYMREYCVRYNWDTWQYVTYLFYRLIDIPDSLKSARELLEKALVDLDSFEALDNQMVQVLHDAYSFAGDEEGSRSLTQFMERLPELREKMTQISPVLREDIEAKQLRRSTESRALKINFVETLHAQDGSADAKSNSEEEPIYDIHKELDQLSAHVHKDGKDKEIEGFISQYLSKNKNPRKGK